jgi:hypothetical protein
MSRGTSGSVAVLVFAFSMAFKAREMHWTVVKNKYPHVATVRST